MERLFGAERLDGRQVVPSLRKGGDRGISLIRYADDFVVTAPSREVLENDVVPRPAVFLADRGLELSAAKTRIVMLTTGLTSSASTSGVFPNGKLLAMSWLENLQIISRYRRGFEIAGGITLIVMGL